MWGLLIVFGPLLAWCGFVAWALRNDEEAWK